MKPCLFPPGWVGIVVNSLAIDSSPVLPDEKIHRFHPVRYGSGLVLVMEGMQKGLAMLRDPTAPHEKRQLIAPQKAQALQPSKGDGR
jgi:hypothetical protein